MSKIISGEDALRALADHKNVVYVAKGYEMHGDDLWSTSNMTKNFSIHDFLSGQWVFKLEDKNEQV